MAWTLRMHRSWSHCGLELEQLIWLSRAIEKFQSSSTPLLLTAVWVDPNIQEPVPPPVTPRWARKTDGRMESSSVSKSTSFLKHTDMGSLEDTSSPKVSALLCASAWGSATPTDPGCQSTARKAPQITACWGCSHLTPKRFCVGKQTFLYFFYKK